MELIAEGPNPGGEFMFPLATRYVSGCVANIVLVVYGGRETGGGGGGLTKWYM